MPVEEEAKRQLANAARLPIVTAEDLPDNLGPLRSAIERPRASTVTFSTSSASAALSSG